MATQRTFHTATLLGDGKVLAAGALSVGSRSAELYDPRTATWTDTGDLNLGRGDFTATLLRDGTVLVTAPHETSTTAELYDPATGAWTWTGAAKYIRLGSYTATLLPDSTVLVVGSVPNDGLRTELYDPATGTWADAPSSLESREYGTATLLQNGTVLAAGGRGSSASAELYVPGPRQ